MPQGVAYGKKSGMVLAWGVWCWYNRDMKRYLIISQGAPTLDDGLCAVRVVENDPNAYDPLRTIHFNGRVNYGVAIVGIMEEWDAYKLVYTKGARDKFLLKKLDPNLLT
jgi:hypothetical protein